jgi:hypothetical protein
MKGLGLALIVVGAIGVFLALGMETTVYVPGQTLGSGALSTNIPSQSVHNLGLVFRQLEWLVVSGMVALSGVLFFGFGWLAEQQRIGAMTVPQLSEAPESKRDDETLPKGGNEKRGREPRGFSAFFASE